MSALQEQAVQMIHGLSDDNVSFVIEIIQRLMLLPPADGGKSMAAFRRLDAARAEIRGYLPEDFDPDQELEEARAERYGGIG